MDIWVIDKLNELFIRGYYTENKFSEKKVISGKIPLFVVDPFLNPHFICPNIAFVFQKRFSFFRKIVSKLE